MKDSTTLTTNDIPKWDLDSLYKDPDSTEYAAAVSDYKKYMEELAALNKSAKAVQKAGADNFDFPLWLSTYLKAANKTGALETSLNAYAYIIYSTDTTNKKYLDTISALDELQLRSKQQQLEFQKILLQYSDQLPDFYERFSAMKKYRYILEEECRQTAHQMTSDEEDLASDLQRTGGDAWSRLHEQLISTMKDTATGKTFNGLRNDAFSADAVVRKQSWEKETALLKQNRIAFAASLNNIKGATVTLNRRRHWDTAVDRAVASSRMDKKTLGALIAAIEDSLPQWRTYFQAKALLLRKTGATADTAGDKNDRGLSFYDLFAPLTADKASEKTWTFAETRDYIIEKFSSFSPEMGAFAKKAFDSGWIDAAVHPGKVGGAYCEDFPVQKESRILSNFTGTFSDVITLSHELGHAFHHDCIKDTDFLLTSYPMTLAETASTFAETIVKKDVITRSEGFEKIKQIELELQDVSQVLVDILCRYYFEQSVFEERSTGELGADDFCRLMKSAQEKSYGSGLNGNRHEYMWAVKSHYYSPDLDFYNFPYAFGQLFAIALYNRYVKEGPAFAAVYKKLLADTGRMSCEDLCREAGFDITTKEFWENSIASFSGEIVTFREYAENYTA
jgi:pepF/M3 family oligoendopeptidase